ncbi:RecBCD enzyme subunit RecB [Psychrosphaera saromensis]|uniref:RecBCD enzyme subunit RecB n=1 Tax=Psychrosphaera saromensis TaxID=716813 RepID=A0A2S7UXW7_9GAMM|nr:exodeoxyribonuclease V subunit beta [Psychrosphaera saromensis]PQJ54332.1 exodeoxyribonuclease V subunit beta [Psychrosphaera saromensis]GHB74204.1 RecBCD enzyme subunit RecB [Psychrosphaera saromensis]GLQ12559.1 RecBCD enzyme subunit RecB [Psychrosphaera saromensis]
MNILNPLTIPLDQNALIEASAGTGKTYTITTLYLRALLGLVDGQPNLRPKSIEQILVVTFTEAATQEIRDRVRKKLLEAQQVLLSKALYEPESGSNDFDSNFYSNWDSNLVELLKTFVVRWIDASASLSPSVSTEKDKEQADSELEQKQQAILYAYHRLQNAITLIDEASIFTIHGFCHRCIKQFAFETNSSFEQKFEMDNKPVLQGALYDFWRKFVVGLNGAEFSWFQQNWRTPDVLYKDIASVLGKSIVLTPQVNEQTYRALMDDYQSLIVTLKQQWQKADFSKILLDAQLKKTGKIYKRIPLLTEFMQSDDWFPPFLKDDDWSLWGTDSLNNSKNYTAKAEPLNHPISQVIDKLAQVEHELKNGGFQSYWLTLAKGYIEQRAQQIKNEQQIINPDDLLTQLLSAINPDSGAGDSEKNNNDLLLNAIRTKYPIAFIDEFQDTDPVQYGIFNAIYNSDVVESTPDNGSSELLQVPSNMILIGDPKQAIYKFRGADIFTYIQAKQDLPETQHYTLATNWRSHPNLINAVNQVFVQSEEGFKQKEIPFEVVSAGQSPSNRLVSNGVDDNQLMFCHLLPDTATSDKIGFKGPEAEGLLAKWCAAQIQTTLLEASENKTYIDKSGKTRAVQANDICVLVRNRNQAGLIKRTLAQLNIRSVFISRDNIFKTALAKDLLRLLMAINSPFNEQKVRAACATRFFGYDVEQLFALQHDPILWQQHLEWFYNAHQTWAYGQISSAIEYIILQADTLSNWQLLEPTEYERLITDQRHLSELIQQQSVKHAGVEKLLHWFEQQVISEDNWSDATDDQQLRLESDSNLVQIATLHASKGLEYPIVYLPFVCEFKAAKSAIYTSNKTNELTNKQGLTYRVDNRKQELQQAEGERLAEDLRLLYVAMTRPIYKLVIGVFNLLDGYKRLVLDNTGIGQLLLGELATDQKPSNDLIQQTCERFVSTENSQGTCFTYSSLAEDLLVTQFNQAKHAGVNLQNDHNAQLQFIPFTGDVKDNWKMLSYSSLVAGAHHLDNTKVLETDKIATVSIAQEQLNDIWVAGLSDEQASVAFVTSATLAKSEPELKPEPELNRFSFPKGANAGTCLHWILENVNFQQPIAEQADVVESGLTRYGIDTLWLSVAVEWMQQVINCSLTEQISNATVTHNQVEVGNQISWSLADINQANCLVEMEFYFNFNRLNSEVICNALRMMGLKFVHFGHFLENDAEPAGLSGIVKGFIDLTVHHQGKYYVVDYKSNFLGDDFASYTQANLAVSMSDHHYEIQALIYTLALHRWLKTRLQDYDYNLHVGGAMYLFLRGMNDKDTEQDQTGVYTMNIKQDVIEYLDSALNDEGENSVKSITVDRAANTAGNISAENITTAKTTEAVDVQIDSAPKENAPTETVPAEAETKAVPQMGFDFD